MTIDRPVPPGGRDGVYDARGKSAAEIESDIERTRSELGAVLGALETRLTPRHLLEKGMDMLKDTIDGGGIGTTLREHPLPLALIGTGIAWLLLSGRADDEDAASGQRLGGRLAGAARAVTDRTRGAAAEVADYAYARTKPQLGAAAGEVARRAGEAASRTRAGLLHAIEANPLAIGVLGLFAGAALALALPQSQVERGWLGPGARRVARTAKELADEAADRADDRRAR